MNIGFIVINEFGSVVASLWGPRCVHASSYTLEQGMATHGECWRKDIWIQSSAWSICIR